MTAVAELSECCASVGCNTAEQQDCEQVEKLQAQLAVQHLYQDASHVMVQRAAQVEIDLDQTAAMLCDEMQQTAKRNAVLQQLTAHLVWERENGRLATAAVCILDAELQQKARDLEAVKHELFITQARLERADSLLATSLNAAQVPDGALRPDCTAEQQAESIGVKKGTFCRPIVKLARHNSSPACCLEVL